MKLTQAILPVAGLGTRFLPWTKTVPKEMLPIGNRPIIALLVDECLSVGIHDICFVISRGKEAIAEYFFEDAGLEEELKKRGKNDLLAELRRYDSVNVHTVYQDEQHGDGHAVLQAKDWVQSDAVAILFGDDLIVGNQNGLQQLSANYNNGVLVTLQDVPKAHVSRYGIVEVVKGNQRLKTITSIVEKPQPENAPSTLAIVGKFIIPKALFTVLPDLATGRASTAPSTGGEIRMVDALIDQLGTLPIQGYVFEGQRFDTGTPEGYKEAIAALG